MNRFDLVLRPLLLSLLVGIAPLTGFVSQSALAQSSSEAQVDSNLENCVITGWDEDDAAGLITDLSELSGAAKDLQTIWETYNPPIEKAVIELSAEVLEKSAVNQASRDKLKKIRIKMSTTQNRIEALLLGDDLSDFETLLVHRQLSAHFKIQSWLAEIELKLNPETDINALQERSWIQLTAKNAAEIRHFLSKEDRKNIEISYLGNMVIYRLPLFFLYQQQLWSLATDPNELSEEKKLLKVTRCALAHLGGGKDQLNQMLMAGHPKFQNRVKLTQEDFDAPICGQTQLKTLQRISKEIIGGNFWRKFFNQWVTELPSIRAIFKDPQIPEASHLVTDPLVETVMAKARTKEAREKEFHRITSRIIKKLEAQGVPKQLHKNLSGVIQRATHFTNDFLKEVKIGSVTLDESQFGISGEILEEVWSQYAKDCLSKNLVFDREKMVSEVRRRHFFKFVSGFRTHFSYGDLRPSLSLKSNNFTFHLQTELGSLYRSTLGQAVAYFLFDKLAGFEALSGLALLGESPKLYEGIRSRSETPQVQAIVSQMSQQMTKSYYKDIIGGPGGVQKLRQEWSFKKWFEFEKNLFNLSAQVKNEIDAPGWENLPYEQDAAFSMIAEDFADVYPAYAESFITVRLAKGFEEQKRLWNILEKDFRVHLDAKGVQCEAVPGWIMSFFKKTELPKTCLFIDRLRVLGGFDRTHPPEAIEDVMARIQFKKLATEDEIEVYQERYKETLRDKVLGANRLLGQNTALLSDLVEGVKDQKHPWSVRYRNGRAMKGPMLYQILRKSNPSIGKKWIQFATHQANKFNVDMTRRAIRAKSMSDFKGLILRSNLIEQFLGDKIKEEYQAVWDFDNFYLNSPHVDENYKASGGWYFPELLKTHNELKKEWVAEEVRDSEMWNDFTTDFFLYGIGLMGRSAAIGLMGMTKKFSATAGRLEKMGSQWDRMSSGWGLLVVFGIAPADIIYQENLKGDYQDQIDFVNVMGSSELVRSGPDVAMISPFAYIDWSDRNERISYYEEQILAASWSQVESVAWMVVPSAAKAVFGRAKDLSNRFLKAWENSLVVSTKSGWLARRSEKYFNWRLQADVKRLQSDFQKIGVELPKYKNAKTGYSSNELDSILDLHRIQQAYRQTRALTKTCVAGKKCSVDNAYERIVERLEERFSPLLEHRQLANEVGSKYLGVNYSSRISAFRSEVNRFSEVPKWWN